MKGTGRGKGRERGNSRGTGKSPGKWANDRETNEVFVDFYVKMCSIYGTV